MRQILLILGMIFSLALPAAAQTAIDPAQKQAFEALIREYLINNPGVLREALTALERHEKDQEEKARSATIVSNSDKLFSSSLSAVLGNPKGDVTLVEFFDYNCGFCKRSLGDIETLLKSDPNLRLVIKEFPVLGRGSVEASQISAQLIGQPRYAEFHNKLLSEKAPADKKLALSVAQSFGYDVKALEAGMNAKHTREVIEESFTIADALNLNGTPTFVIGNEVVVGAVGISVLRAKIEAMRKCGKTQCVAPAE